MYRNQIRKLLALALMGIFVLCNTPTNVLHSLFADHKDQKSELLIHSSSPEISASGIDCHCNSNVVTAPYLPETIAINILHPRTFHNYQECLNDIISTNEELALALRGPPILN